MKSIVIAVAIATTICTMDVSVAAEGAPVEPKAFRQIPIPKREHGYGRMQSVVIRTKTELDGFLKNVRGQRGWNNLKGFEDTITKAKIDFRKEALVLLRHTEGSGSVQVIFENPTLRKKALSCRITRKVPKIGTADMAYYCFALALSKSAADTVELHVQGKKPIKFSIVEKQSNKPDAGDGK